MMDILLIIGAALFMIFFFGMCIFVHELGHFLAAKWRGLHIVAFSIGFKKVWGKTYKGVEYRIGCIPCGGYVDLPQIDSASEEKVVDGIKLPPAKPIDRIITAAAGPLFNILFGLLLGLLVWHYGVPSSSPKMDEIVVESIEQNSPEYKAGLRVGDKIIKLNGKKFHKSWQRVVSDIVFTVGEVKLTVKRGAEVFEFAYVPVENPHVMGKERIGFPFFRPSLPLTLYPLKDSPAARAGIKSGDIMIELNGKKISDLNEINYILALSGQNGVSMLVKRGNQQLAINNIVPKTETFPGIYKIGITYSPGTAQAVVGQVIPGSPAEKAGLKEGDRIVRIGNGKIVKSENIPELVNKTAGKPTEVELVRNGNSIILPITPIPNVTYDFGIDFTVIDYPSPFQQLYDIVTMTYNSVRSIIYGMGSKIGVTEKSSTLKPSNLSGPLGIGTMIFKSVYYGSLIQGIYIIVMITFSLGLLNIMPLPVLDGGHIVLAVLEMVFRRPVSPRILQPIYVMFITLLIAFMAYVSCYDVYRWIPSAPAPAAEKAAKKDATPATATDKQEQNHVPAQKNP